jgi:hypothetical protein
MSGQPPTILFRRLQSPRPAAAALLLSGFKDRGGGGENLLC